MTFLKSSELIFYEMWDLGQKPRKFNIYVLSVIEVNRDFF